MSHLQLEDGLSSAPLELKTEWGEMRPIVVRAGAGAGKTTELVRRVLALGYFSNEKNGKFPRLMVTTFTRKATQELKERLLLSALETQKMELVQFVQSPSHLHISTIHGILALFLRRYGQALGLKPDFRLMESRQEEKLLKKIIKQKASEWPSLAAVLEVQTLPQLLPELLKFFEEKRSHKKMEPFSLKEMQQARANLHKEVSLLVAQLAESIEVDYPEAWQKLKQHLEAYQPNWALSDLQTWFEAQPSVRASAKISEVAKSNREELKAQLELLLSYSYSDLFFKEHESLIKNFNECASALDEELFKLKISQGLLTMSDLENFSLRLLQEQPQVFENFSREWDYWLVDEYQDTSPRQVMLIKALTNNKSIFVVGDPQQSIYLFRGAQVRVFEEQEKTVAAIQGTPQGAGPGELSGKLAGELKKLFVNYRSRGGLLQLMNRIFTELPSISSTGIQQPFLPMSVGRKEQEGNKASEVKTPEGTYWDLSELAQAEKKSTEKLSENPAEKSAPSQFSLEARAAVVRMQELLKAGASPDQICILSRKNSSLKELSSLALSLGLPVQNHADSSFLQRREIQDALLLLRFLVNPHDNINLVALLRTPWFRYCDQKIYELCKGKPDSYWNQLKNLSDEPLVQTLQKGVMNVGEQGITATWIKWLRQSGAFDLSHYWDDSGMREANLWKLVQKISMQERQPGFNFNQLFTAAETNLDQDHDVMSEAVPVSEPQKIQLMSIHASKGLQFDHIILIGAGDWRMHSDTSFFMADDTGKFSLSLADPDTGVRTSSIHGYQQIKKRQNQEKLEYDRLLYVALTRAKNSMTIIWDQSQKDSWAARMWQPAGEDIYSFENDGYSYQVQLRKDEPQPRMKSGEWQYGATQKISPWSSPAAQDVIKEKKMSITAIVESGQALRSNETSGSATDDHESTKNENKNIVEALKKAQFGTDVHRWFELMKYKPNIAIPAELKPYIDWSMQIESGLLKRLIQKGFVEDGFVLKWKSLVLQGQIDLWGYDDSEANTQGGSTIYVVDYKTGSDIYKDKAIKQLELYAWALRQMGAIKKNDQVKLLVVYPLQKSYELLTASAEDKIEKVIERAIQDEALM